MLTPWKESYDQPRQHIEKQRHYFSDKVSYIVKVMVFPVVMYGCESWTITKYVCAKLLQLCLTLCNPMDCNPPGFSVHGIFQARILEWVAISFSRGSSQPRNPTQVSCIVGRYFYHLSPFNKVVLNLGEEGPTVNSHLE